MAVRVLEETGLLPHLNPGVMSWAEINRLKPVAPSMGMMLETTSTRLFTEKGQAHHGSPDKDPAVRLRVLEDAGRLSVPFTTGLLVGIGETLEERADSIFALRRVARAFGHVQEVIVQNFRAKPDTAMRSVDDLGLEEYLAAIAVTRLVLGPKMRVQAPPNLVDLDECRALLGAGVDDWGGVSPLTPDHVNPERPWPSLDRLRAVTAEAGFALRERLTVHPSYVAAGDPWIDPRVRPHVAALADADGSSAPASAPSGCPGRSPTGGFDPRPAAPTSTPRSTRGPDHRPALRLRRRLRRLGVPPRAVAAQDAAQSARRAGTERREGRSSRPGGRGSPRRTRGWVWPPRSDGGAERVVARRRARLRDLLRRKLRTTPTPLTPSVAAALRQAEKDPKQLTDAQALALFTADGDDLDAVRRWPTRCAARSSATT